MKIKLSIAAALAIASISAHAVEQTCETGTVNCNFTDLGDKDQSADNSVSESTQNNPSSNSNQSGNTIAPDNKDVNNNSNDGSITGGNTSSRGGSAIGNKSDNANNSHASNGNQSSSNTQGQGQSSSNKNANAQGQSSANSNKVAGSKQGQSSSNSNSMGQALSNSGNSASGSNSSLGRSGNSMTQVDASNNSSYSSSALVKAPTVHTDAIKIQGALMNTVVGQCAPISHVSETPVYGTHVGWFKNRAVPLGFTHQVSSSTGAPFIYYTAPDGAIYEMGEQVVLTMSVTNVGSSRSMSVDISKNLGEGASGGGSNSSAMQRQSTTAQKIPCVYAIYYPEVKKVEPETQDYSYLINGQKG